MNRFLKVIQLHKNETQLIKRAIKNQREAQRILFEMHSPKMLSVCRYYVKDMMQAEEVMLSGFLKVFQKLETYQFGGSFEGWIRRIMVRTCIDHLRKKQPFEVAIDEVTNNEQLQVDAISNLDVAVIQKLIDTLPDGYKTVFIMYAIEGYKHNEIAATLNISEGTSKSQLYKARKLLQTQVQLLNRKHNGTS